MSISLRKKSWDSNFAHGGQPDIGSAGRASRTVAKEEEQRRTTKGEHPTKPTKLVS